MRPTREELLVETAFTWAKRSTCSRLQVGAVVHRDGRILVQGYNGAAAGLPHCNHQCDCGRTVKHGPPHAVGCNSEMPCLDAVHAEQNAIAFAAKWGVELNHASLVTTHQPCKGCAMSIINAGIEMVTYVYPYRLVDGLSLLMEAGLVVEQYLDWEEPRLIGSSGDEG